MSKQTKDNRSVEERLTAAEEAIEVLKAAVNYAVYGIGTAHPDPREQSEPEKG